MTKRESFTMQGCRMIPVNLMVAWIFQNEVFVFIDIAYIDFLHGFHDEIWPVKHRNPWMLKHETDYNRT